MGTDFFGERKKKKRPKAESSGVDESALHDEILDAFQEPEDTDEAFGRPESTASFIQLELAIAKYLNVEDNPSMDGFPPRSPFTMDFIKHLLDLGLLSEYMTQMSDLGIDIQSKDVDVDALVELDLDSRNIKFAALMMKSLGFMNKVFYDVLDPKTSKEKNLFSIISSYESILYNIRTALSLKASFMMALNKDVPRELADMLDIVEQNMEEDGSAHLDKDTTSKLIEAMHASIDADALEISAVEEILKQLNQQYMVQGHILRAWNEKHNNSSGNATEES